MAITSAVTDLIKSVGELLSSFVHAIYSIIHTFVSGIVHLFGGVISFTGDIFQGVLDLLGGVGKFVAGMSILTLFFLYCSIFLRILPLLGLCVVALVKICCLVWHAVLCSLSSSATVIP